MQRPCASAAASASLAHCVAIRVHGGGDGGDGGQSKTSSVRTWVGQRYGKAQARPVNRLAKTRTKDYCALCPIFVTDSYVAEYWLCQMAFISCDNGGGPARALDRPDRAASQPRPKRSLDDETAAAPHQARRARVVRPAPGGRTQAERSSDLADGIADRGKLESVHDAGDLPAAILGVVGRAGVQPAARGRRELGSATLRRHELRLVSPGREPFAAERLRAPRPATRRRHR